MTVQVKELVKTYTMGSVEVPALKGVSFEIDQNEYVSIMGPSGSGKSTMMNLLGCLDVATSGTYHIDGRDVSTLKEDQLAEIRNRKIGFVFQTFNLIPRTDVFHNVELPLIYGGLSRSKRKNRVEGAIESVGLTERMRHKPTELSGGERQRVAIARALVNRPSMILADEPTGNLDTATGEEIMAIFGSLNEAGNTILLVTLEDAMARYTKRTIRLRDGLIENDAPMETRGRNLM